MSTIKLNQNKLPNQKRRNCLCWSTSNKGQSDPEKVRAVQAMTKPSNMKELFKDVFSIWQKFYLTWLTSMHYYKSCWKRIQHGIRKNKKIVFKNSRNWRQLPRCSSIMTISRRTTRRICFSGFNANTTEICTNRKRDFGHYLWYNKVSPVPVRKRSGCHIRSQYTGIYIQQAFAKPLFIYKRCC